MPGGKFGGSSRWYFGTIFGCLRLIHPAGQIIYLTPNGGLVREILLFQENPGWWNIAGETSFLEITLDFIFTSGTYPPLPVPKFKGSSQTNKSWILIDQQTGPFDYTAFTLDQAVQGLSRTVNWLYNKHGILIFPHPTKHQTVPLKRFGFRGHPAGIPRRAKLNNPSLVDEWCHKNLCGKTNFKLPLPDITNSTLNSQTWSSWKESKLTSCTCHFGTAYHLTGWCSACCRCFLFLGWFTVFNLSHVSPDLVVFYPWVISNSTLMNIINMFSLQLSWIWIACEVVGLNISLVHLIFGPSSMAGLTTISLYMDVWFLLSSPGHTCCPRILASRTYQREGWWNIIIWPDPGRLTAGTYSHHPWKERKMIWTKPPWGHVPCWSSGV